MEQTGLYNECDPLVSPPIFFAILRTLPKSIQLAIRHVCY